MACSLLSNGFAADEDISSLSAVTKEPITSAFSKEETYASSESETEDILDLQSFQAGMGLEKQKKETSYSKDFRKLVKQHAEQVKKMKDKSLSKKDRKEAEENAKTIYQTIENKFPDELARARRK